MRESLRQRLVQRITITHRVVEDNAHVTVLELLAAPHGNHVGAGISEVTPESITVALGVLAADTDVVGCEEAVAVGYATLLVEVDVDFALLDVVVWGGDGVWVGHRHCVWGGVGFGVGEGGDHEAGCHEGEEDVLD